MERCRTPSREYGSWNGSDDIPGDRSVSTRCALFNHHVLKSKQCGSTKCHTQTCPAPDRGGLKSKNVLETLDPLVDESITRINRWRTSGQKQRWHTAALPDIESHLR